MELAPVIRTFDEMTFIIHPSRWTQRDRRRLPEISKEAR